MNFELYEVWTVDPDGHEQLVDTTRSLKEARQMALEAQAQDRVEVVIYRDTDGELSEVTRLPP
jgi:hypothetical protein